MSTETTLVLLLLAQLVLLLVIAGVAVRSARARDELAHQLDRMGTRHIEALDYGNDWRLAALAAREAQRTAEDERDAALALLQAVTTDRPGSP